MVPFHDCSDDFLLLQGNLMFCYLMVRYEEAREEEKLRSQREDFSDMVAEVRAAFRSLFSRAVFMFEILSFSLMG